MYLERIYAHMVVSDARNGAVIRYVLKFPK
jgi:hypothetical protein